MELVEGAHLLEHLRAASRMSELQVQWYTAELTAALTWLHSGLVVQRFEAYECHGVLVAWILRASETDRLWVRILRCMVR